MDERTVGLSRSATASGRTSRGRLLDVLRRQGPAPRVALARATGLSFAAISAISSKLIAEALLCEGESEAGAAALSEAVRTEDAGTGEGGRPSGRLAGAR